MPGSRHSLMSVKKKKTKHFSEYIPIMEILWSHVFPLAAISWTPTEPLTSTLGTSIDMELSVLSFASWVQSKKSWRRRRYDVRLQKTFTPRTVTNCTAIDHVVSATSCREVVKFRNSKVTQFYERVMTPGKCGINHLDHFWTGIQSKSRVHLTECY